MKIYQLTDDLTDVNSKKILIYTGDFNLIELARKNELAYEQYKKLLTQDYILYFHKDGISRFQKRTYINELWVKKDLHKYNDVYYSLEAPHGRKDNKELSSSLLVLFPCMAPVESQDNYLIRTRMFTHFFKNISMSLVKNVYIMRIMDLNCSHGSHFVNTINYPNMEKDIQLAIQAVVNKLKINKEQVVLYGASKGGTGAILHGAMADYKALAVDPIISLEYYNRSDYHFLKDMREVDLSDCINNYLKDTINKKYIICSPNVKFNYDHVQKINNHDSLKTIELVDNHITKHPHVSQNSVPIQLMVLNSLFTNFI